MCLIGIRKKPKKRADRRGHPRGAQRTSAFLPVACCLGFIVAQTRTPALVVAVQPILKLGPGATSIAINSSQIRIYKMAAAFYGDLMTGLSYALFLPVYGSSWWMEPVRGSGSVVFFLSSACIFNWIAWFRRSMPCSILGFLLQTGCITTMAIFAWPYGEQSTLLAQYLWSLFIHLSGNVAMPFYIKAVLGLHSACCATMASFYSPTITMLDNLPMYIGALTFYLAVHHRASHQPEGPQHELFSAQLAVFLLVGT